MEPRPRTVEDVQRDMDALALQTGREFIQLIANTSLRGIELQKFQAEAAEIEAAAVTPVST